MNTSKVVMILTLFFSSICFADSYYCPKTAQYIDFGSDQEMVVQACGQPISKSKKTVKVKEPVQVTNFVYRYDQGSPNAQVPNMPVRSPTTRPPVVISFINGVVSSITVSGMKVQGTTACDKTGNQSISIGMTQAQIGQICGEIPDEYYGTTTERTVGSKEVETWTYQFFPNGPLVQFNFEDGKLTNVTQ